MLRTKFQYSQISVLEKKILKGFLQYIGKVVILVTRSKQLQ